MIQLPWTHRSEEAAGAIYGTSSSESEECGPTDRSLLVTSGGVRYDEGRWYKAGQRPIVYWLGAMEIERIRALCCCS